MTSSDKPTVSNVVEMAKKPAGKKSGKAASTGNGGGDWWNRPKSFGDYVIKKGSFHQIKTVRSSPENLGVVEFPLCDFVARIVEEVIADDGLGDAAFLRIEGRRADGAPLPVVDVPAKSFLSTQGNWPSEAWGMLPFLYPGAAKKDNLRACIQLFSRLDGDIPRRTIYKYTGWKKINDQWHYLTGTGAITVDGLVNDVQVDMGAGHMSRFQLPAALSGDALKQAFAQMQLLLNICPGKPYIGAALLAAAVRAPLGECAPTDFAIWLHGLTGSRKSAIASIAQAFFGIFTDRTFPANWSDSANDAEMKSHQAKDAVFVIDDFKPSVSRTEAEKMHAMAERLIRNTGNQAGRGRRGADMQARAAPHNRSMMLVTAEDLPRGQSLLGRLLILELTRADVDNSVLTKLQNAVEAGNFAGLMSTYLQWCSPRLDKLKKDFPEIVRQLRAGAIRDGFASSHPRAPEIFANLVAAADVFSDFLTDAGILTPEQSNSLLFGIETSLKQALTEQSIYQSEQDEVERFLQLLRSVLSSGNGYIANRLDQGPPKSRPFAWGWRDQGSDLMGDKTYKPNGDCIGWHYEASEASPAEVWLERDTAFKAVQQFARAQGEAFLLSAPSLWRRMHEKGLIMKTEPDSSTGKPRTAIKRVVAGRNVRVMILVAELIESGQ